MQSTPIHERRALDLVLKMMALPGVSGREGPVVEFIRRQLRRCGVPASWIETDDAHRRSPLGGQVGNLVCRLPGKKESGPRRLLMAHIDTVPLCEGSRPIVRQGRVRSAHSQMALGADNRSGAAALLVAAMELRQRALPHPPLTFLWPVQEEVGLHGARLVRLARLGRPKLAFNFDGGRPEELVIGATGAYHIDIMVEGTASHAGAHPEDGVSAVVIASRAISELNDRGWHGLIRKGRRTGTSNVGAVRGGAATNVVTDRVQIRAEARSHNGTFLKRIIQAYRDAFERAARQVKNVHGDCGCARVRDRMAYESFRLAHHEPCVVEAERAVAATGMVPRRRIVNGGLDANWLTARGIPTVSLGCGQRDFHTVREHLIVPEYIRACRLALRLATGS